MPGKWYNEDDGVTTVSVCMPVKVESWLSCPSRDGVELDKSGIDDIV